jgi:hypothetical protein
MGSSYLPQLNARLLKSYCNAALCNARELFVEASLLQEHCHYARAYFLAISCVEETGKALLAFDAQNKQLSDPAVCTKIRKSFESHRDKIYYAIIIWAFSSSNPRQALLNTIALTGGLQRGREPSLYCDLYADPDRAKTPSDIVSASAAGNCVRMAKDCLDYAQSHVIHKEPANFSKAQKYLFKRKSAYFEKILESPDFHEYCLNQPVRDMPNVVDMIFDYDRKHIKTGIPFLGKS